MEISNVFLDVFTDTRKKQTERANRFVLTNPFLNPTGFVTHMFKFNDIKTGIFDSPIAKYLVERNNERYQKYYDKLSPFEKVQEFYKNGGKGVRFDS